MSEFATARPHLEPRRSIPDRGRRQALPVPPLTDPCDCLVPLTFNTDGEGEVLQTCLRCGLSNVVARRPGMVTVSKARAAELTMFGPIKAL